ncbi:protein of unknown function (plasmid) [Rhodovastum atsumiense]|nr:protein of unknown function [Rhodovastum atsumiense]
MTTPQTTTELDPNEGYVPACVSRPPWRRPRRISAREAELERAQDVDERRVETGLGGTHIQAVRYE